MATDPEPEHEIAIKTTDRTIAASDSSGVDRFRGVDLLELEARVSWVSAEQTVRLPGMVLHVVWKRVERRPEARRGLGRHSLSGSSGRVRPSA